jgi:hypothetical protein
MYLEQETIKRLKGAASLLEHGSMRLNILGDKGNSKILSAEAAAIRYFLSCNEDEEN